MDYLSWLGGLIDGEGSFHIQIAVRKGNKSGRLNVRFNPVVSIQMHIREKEVLKDIIPKVGLGRFYEAEPAKNRSALARWQTTNLRDGSTFAGMISPFLIIKKSTAERFQSACDLLLACMYKANRAAGERSYDLETALTVTKIACSLNTRSVKRYPQFKSYEEWEPILRDIYDQPMYQGKEVPTITQERLDEILKQESPLR